MTLVIPPAQAEDFILGSIGLGMSPWRTYQIATGQIEPDPPIVSELELSFRQNLLHYLESRFDAFLNEDESNIFFTPDVALEPILRIGYPGKLNAKSGDILILEMLEQNTYDKLWEKNSGITVPFLVRARATMRMKATGSREALVWVVTGLGKVDEFHSVAYDENLANRMTAATIAMTERIREHKAPDVEDDDVETALSLLGDRNNSTRVVEVGEPIIAAISEYESTVAQRLNLDQASNQLKATEQTLKKTILKELIVTPALVLPDKRIVSSKTIRKAASLSKPSSWERLDIYAARN
jgi:hypothetical protein